MIATIKYGLTKIPVVNKDCSSEIALKALNISIITNTVKLRVLAFCFPQVKYKQGSYEKSYLP